MFKAGDLAVERWDVTNKALIIILAMLENNICKVYHLREEIYCYYYLKDLSLVKLEKIVR